MKKRAFIWAIGCALTSNGLIAQEIKHNEFLLYVDYDFNMVNTRMRDHALKTEERTRCEKDSVGSSCPVVYQGFYSDSGLLIREIRGGDIRAGKIDFETTYRKLADTLFQAITKYPLGSTMIPQGLFGKDKDSSVYMRSVIKLFGGALDSIRRYNLDSNLVEVCVLDRQPAPLRSWEDSINDPLGITITQHTLYAHKVCEEKNIYNKKGQLLENVSITTDTNNKRTFYVRTVFGYDMQGNLLLKARLGDDGLLTSHERYFYKAGRLVRYIMEDLNFDGKTPNNEQVFNEKGMKIYEIRKNNYVMPPWMEYYTYNSDDLIKRMVVYNGGRFQYAIQYRYR